MTTLEYRVANSLYFKTLEFAQWLLRSGFYSDLGLWFDDFGWLEDLEPIDGAPFPVAMPNVPFPPENHPEFSDQMYLEVRNFRNTTLSNNWGIERTIIGILQVSVINPKQTGELEAVDIAGLLTKHFIKNTSIWTENAERIVIYEHPSLLTALQDGQKSAYPVSIPYRCFVNA